VDIKTASLIFNVLFAKSILDFTQKKLYNLQRNVFADYSENLPDISETLPD